MNIDLLSHKISESLSDHIASCELIRARESHFEKAKSELDEAQARALTSHQALLAVIQQAFAKEISSLEDQFNASQINLDACAPRQEQLIKQNESMNDRINSLIIERNNAQREYDTLRSLSELNKVGLSDLKKVISNKLALHQRNIPSLSEFNQIFAKGKVEALSEILNLLETAHQSNQP